VGGDVVVSYCVCASRLLSWNRGIIKVRCWSRLVESKRRVGAVRREKEGCARDLK